MNASTCGQCGGTFETKTLGPLRDKVAACPFCGHSEDVPDEYEVTREEVFNDGPGRTRRVRVTERRSDLPSGAVPLPAAFRGGTLDPRAFFEQMKAEGRIPADAEFTPDENGGFEYHTSDRKVTTHATASARDAAEKLRGMMGEGFDPFGDLAGAIAGGKTHSRATERHETRATPPPRSPDTPSAPTPSVTLVKWLVVLGALVLATVLAVKLL